MAIQGLFDNDSWASSDERPLNWREGILLLYPNGMAPLTALTSLMKTKSTDDPQFHWWDKVLSEQRATLSVDVATGDNNLTFASGAMQFVKGHLLLIEESGEIVRVNADPTIDTNILVTREFSGTSDIALVDISDIAVSDKVRAIGTAHEEGSSKPTAVTYTPTKHTNYTQIFRTNAEITGSAAETNVRTRAQAAEGKREALEYHSIEMEMAFWLGRANEETSLKVNGRPTRTTGGFEGFLEAFDTGAVGDDKRIVTATATTSLTQFEGYMKRLFTYGSTEKVAFCGNGAMLTLNQIARLNADVFHMTSGQKEFGMNVRRFMTPFGDLVLKTHPLFSRMTSGQGSDTWTSMEHQMNIMDMGNAVYRPLRGRDTKWMPNQETPGDDRTEGGYLTEAGMEFHHPQNHMVIKGLNAAVAG